MRGEDPYIRLRNFALKSEPSIENHVPPQPAKSYRVILELNKAEKRLDVILLAALRGQKKNLDLQNISRVAFKKLFADGKVLIKGQRARVSSAIAKGTTYVDILGY